MTALTLPLILIVLTSLSDSPIVGLPIDALTLRWYAAALANPANTHAFLLSAGLAIASATLAVVAGTWIALTAKLIHPCWRWLLLAATALPLVTPGLVHAIALRVTMQVIGLPPGVLAILLGHTIHATPLAAIMVGVRLSSIPRDLTDAAQDLGAGPLRAFLAVQLPWLAPTLAGAALLAGLSSFDDFIRSFFLGGYDTTLPVLLFAHLRAALTPEINALATLSLLGALLLGAAVLALRAADLRRNR